MARNNSSNRGGNNRGGNGRGSNNNPSGNNQYSDWGVLELARERPLTATAVAAGAAAVGLFAWSRRSQISNQLSGLSSQIGEWSQNMGWSGDEQNSSFDDTAGLATATATDAASTTSTGKSRRGKKSQADFSNEALSLKETGKAQQPEAIG